MAGKLDEISVMLGGLTAEVKHLGQTMKDNRDVADQRHAENKQRLDNIDTTLSTLSPTVAWMKPIVKNYQVTRWKVIGGLAVVGVIMWLLGWIVSAFAAKLLALIWSAVTRT